jgi:glycosyltransferase involved in cell wall biosynthesis
VVLPRGIDAPPPRAPATRARVRQQLGITPEQTVVMYLGRMVPAKGVIDLAQAVAPLLAEHPALVCLLVGATPEFDESERVNEILTRNGAAGNAVRLLPGCPHAQVWDYLAAADIFAFPSYSEGMPNSLLEAMAAGVAAVAYAIPPVLELDGGRAALGLARPRNVADFSRALKELIRSPAERARLAERGRQRVMQDYLAERTLAEAVRRIALSIDGALAPAPTMGADAISAR